jgi:hypothetical protein
MGNAIKALKNAAGNEVASNVDEAEVSVIPLRQAHTS